METSHKIEEISMDKIISSIKETRDQQIDELKKEPVLMIFLEHYYDTVAINEVKKLFLLRDLAELRSSQLDLAHCSSLITQMKELKTKIIDGNNKLFFAELEKLF